jgi:hypothetical protein
MVLFGCALSFESDIVLPFVLIGPLLSIILLPFLVTCDLSYSSSVDVICFIAPLIR